MANAAAFGAENQKLQSNTPKCQELGWSCTTLAVETYGNILAQNTFSSLAPHQKSKTLYHLCCRTGVLQTYYSAGDIEPFCGDGDILVHRWETQPKASMH